MGIRFLKIAAVYLAIGVTMGLAMGITQKFALHPVHAHINLLGWATMALAGLIYVQFPAAAQTRLAKIHFWIHNLALPVMMVALAFLLSGYAQALYFLEPASTAMVARSAAFRREPVPQRARRRRRAPSRATASDASPGCCRRDRAMTAAKAARKAPSPPAGLRVERKNVCAAAWRRDAEARQAAAQTPPALRPLAQKSLPYNRGHAAASLYGTSASDAPVVGRPQSQGDVAVGPLASPAPLMRLLRLARIVTVALKHGLDDFLLGHERSRWLRPIVHGVLFWRDLSAPRAVRLRLALEDLGPIFVKFGQMLSTRRDLLPPDIADELAKLQDRVPPFPSEQVIATLARIYGKPIDAGLPRVRSRCRSRARRSRRCISPSCPTARRWRSRCCGPNIGAGHRAGPRADADRRDAGRAAVVAKASG